MSGRRGGQDQPGSSGSPRRRSPSPRAERKKRSSGISPGKRLRQLAWGLVPWWVLLLFAGLSMMEEENHLGAWLAMSFSPWWLVAPVIWAGGALLLRRWSSALIHAFLLSAISVGLGWFQLPNPFRAKVQGESFRVLSYNIKGCLASDCYSVTSVMREAKADVVLLQEGFGPRLYDDLARDLPGWKVLGTGTRLVLTRLPVKMWRSGDLIPGHKFGYTLAVIETPAGEVSFITIHQPTYNLRTAFGQGLRRGLGYPLVVAKDQEGLTKALVELVEKERKIRPVVFGGDFNSPATGRTHLLLRGQAQDAFAEAGLGWNLTFPSSMPIIGIDRIFVDSRLAVDSARVIPTQASDHRPLLAVIGSADSARGEQKKAP